MLVPETDEHEAYMLAERLRQAVRDAFAGDDPALTISFGVAVYPRHGHSAESLFLAADQALYAAKELGRDRTVIHNPEIAEVMGVAARARDYGDADGFLATVLALAEALEARGEGSISSARVVSRYAELIAREMAAFRGGRGAGPDRRPAARRGQGRRAGDGAQQARAARRRRLAGDPPPSADRGAHPRLERSGGHPRLDRSATTSGPTARATRAA